MSDAEAQDSLDDAIRDNIDKLFPVPSHSRIHFGYYVRADVFDDHVDFYPSARASAAGALRLRKNPDHRGSLPDRPMFAIAQSLCSGHGTWQEIPSCFIVEPLLAESAPVPETAPQGLYMRVNGAIPVASFEPILWTIVGLVSFCVIAVVALAAWVIWTPSPTAMHRDFSRAAGSSAIPAQVEGLGGVKAAPPATNNAAKKESLAASPKADAAANQ